MSGFEIAGVVLGAIPIAIEIYDRSGRVFEVFTSLKQYPREVRVLDAKLGAQRTIFRNNAIALLTAITRDQESVHNAINHPKPSNASLDLDLAPIYRNRIDALHESFASCAQTAEQIRSSLLVLCEQSDNFRAEVGEKRDDISTSEWIRHVKSRFRLAIYKPKIEEAITNLREFNEDFGLVSDQIIKSLQQICNEGNGHSLSTRRPAKSLNVLQKYHRVRYASRALYSTLQVRWLCSTHRYHSFDMRVIDGDDDSKRGNSNTTLSRYITCELAVNHDDHTTPKEPLHLEIQQACNSDDDEPEKPANDSSEAQKLTKVLEANAARIEPVAPNVKVPRRLKFLNRFRKDKQSPPVATQTLSIPQLPKITQSMSNIRLSDQSTQRNSASSTDLSLLDDICDTAHKTMAGCQDRSFLGSWDGPHAQWFCVKQQLSSKDGESRPLAEIIGWISEEPVLRSLPRPLLVELAGNVAEGIMQFYSTPWLVSDDLGHTVRYYGPSETNSAAVQLKGPYFMTRLEQKGLPQSSAGNLSSDGPVNFSDARNQLLFRFGILMLEIGYGRPWPELRQIVAMNHKDMSDYRIAEKLADQLVNQLGLAYPKMIKKCLGCDFGLGETDMDNEDLQRRFVEDVVAGLKQLKDYMMEMNIAPLG